MKREIAANYAQAIFNLYGDVSSELKRIKQFSDEYIGFFKNPNMALEEKLAAWSTKLAPIMRVIVKGGHIDLLQLIYKELKKIVRENSIVKSVVVESADREISKDIPPLLKKRFKRDIDIEHRYNEEIMSGFILKYDDFVIDLSLKGMLEDIKELKV